MPKGLEKAGPGIRLPLATTVEPFAQHPATQMDVQLTALCIVRDGIVVQMPLHPPLGPTKQFARGQQVAVPPYPIGTPSQ